MCDSAQGFLWDRLERDGDLRGRTMKRIWEKGSVIRSNTLHMFRSYETVSKTIRIEPRLSKIGRTSWEVVFEVRNDEEDENREDTSIARLTTTMVATDEEHTKSVALPNPDKLRGLISGNVKYATMTKDPRTRFVRASTKTAKLRWQSRVRVTDCDKFGHVNNAIYPLLCEEARAWGSQQFDTTRASTLALMPANFCSVNYIGQARPLDDLVVLTHFDEESDCFYFDIQADGHLVAEVILGVDSNSSDRIARL